MKEPLKWKKYLKLVEFGFVTLSELETDIVRYTRSYTQELTAEIARRLGQDEVRKQRHLYVVKLVSPNLQGQLPNYRVETNLDLDGLTHFLQKNDSGSHSELWCCRTRIDDQVFSVAGRVVFVRDYSPRAQIVEQLWRTSPRLLESFSGECKYAYGRASRYSWGWPYFLDNLHLPSGSELSPSLLRDQFLYSLGLFERERDKIEIFVEFLDSFGFNAHSLEYKIVGSKLSIIDWDTPNDKIVLVP